MTRPSWAKDISPPERVVVEWETERAERPLKKKKQQRELKKLKLRLKSKQSHLMTKKQPEREAGPRQINGRSRLLFEWRNAFRAVEDKSPETGLPAGTRHVLLTISMFMNMDGTGAYPGQERIASETGLSINTVKTHIKLAMNRGWLLRKRNHYSRYGRGYSYIPKMPHGSEGLTGSTHDGVN